MKGLFRISYDYHRWDDLMCVSNDESALVEKAAEKESQIPIIKCRGESHALNDREKPHWLITDIEVLPDGGEVK